MPVSFQLKMDCSKDMYCWLLKVNGDVAVLVLVFLRYCICSIWYCSTSCYRNRCKHRAGQSPAQQESFLFNFRSIEVDVDFAVEGLVPKSEDGFIERRRVPYPLVLVPRQNI
jgi:hypothetical protein